MPIGESDMEKKIVSEFHSPKKSCSSAIMSTLVKWGIVKNLKAAGRLLILLSVLCAIDSSAILFFTVAKDGSAGAARSTLSPEVIARLPLPVQEKILKNTK